MIFKLFNTSSKLDNTRRNLFSALSFLLAFSFVNKTHAEKINQNGFRLMLDTYTESSKGKKLVRFIENGNNTLQIFPEVTEAGVCESCGEQILLPIKFEDLLKSIEKKVASPSSEAIIDESKPLNSNINYYDFSNILTIEGYKMFLSESSEVCDQSKFTWGFASCSYWIDAFMKIKLQKKSDNIYSMTIYHFGPNYNTLFKKSGFFDFSDSISPDLAIKTEQIDLQYTKINKGNGFILQGSDQKKSLISIVAMQNKISDNKIYYKLLYDGKEIIQGEAKRDF